MLKKGGKVLNSKMNQKRKTFIFKGDKRAWHLKECIVKKLLLIHFNK